MIYFFCPKCKCRVEGERERLCYVCLERELRAESARLRDELSIHEHGIERRLDQLCAERNQALEERDAALEQQADSSRTFGEFVDSIAAAVNAPEWDYPGQVIRDVQQLKADRDAAIARAKSAEAQAAALQEALMGLYPSANNPADLCFCQPCHDVQDFGHQARCVKARAAIRASLGKEGANG